MLVLVESGWLEKKEEVRMCVSGLVVDRSGERVSVGRDRNLKVEERKSVSRDFESEVDRGVERGNKLDKGPQL